MNTYVIRREKAWESPDDLGKTAERSKEVAADEFPDDIAWIRSYVISEDGGTLGTVCIYQASSIERRAGPRAARRDAGRRGARGCRYRRRAPRSAARGGDRLTMDPERVRIEIADGVADVRMVRAAKHNGLDGRMFDCAQRGDRRARAATTSCAPSCSRGEGPSFCAGLDIKSFAESGGPGPARARRRRGRKPRPEGRLRLARDVPVPVIAALHGACFGGGLQIALGADIRIAAPDARLSVMEIVHGLIPDMSITQTLPRLVRDDVARELVYTGRQVDAEEAQRLGLVTGVDDDPLEAARELAATIAERRPEAIRNAKRLLNEAPELDPAGALRAGDRAAGAAAGRAQQFGPVTGGHRGRISRRVALNPPYGWFRCGSAVGWRSRTAW